MTAHFKDKVALITGAGSGLGRATALAFADEGSRVAVADIDLPSAEETVLELTARGADAIALRVDVTKEQDVSDMVAETVGKLGGLDYAFNNAGILGPRALLHEMSEANWDRVSDTNLKSVWLCMKHEIKHMLECRGGSIVNASSVAGLVGIASTAAYSASKHGVLGLTKTAALQYSDKGIRINAVCPGLIPTPLWKGTMEGEADYVEKMASHHPIKRLGTPEEVAAAVLWLSSGAASFIVGHALPVDGGWTAQ